MPSGNFPLYWYFLVSLVFLLMLAYRTNIAAYQIDSIPDHDNHPCPKQKWIEWVCRGLNCTTPRHAKITKFLLLEQITNLNLIADALIVADKISLLPMRRRLDYNLRVRQLLSIQRSKLHILIDSNATMWAFHKQAWQNIAACLQ